MQHARGDIEVLLGSLEKGFVQAGIARLSREDRVSFVIEIISSGSAQQVDHLMREVVGEAISLSAGTSSMGGSAMEAFSLMQAMAFVSTRASNGKFENNITAQNWCIYLLTRHRDMLTSWIRCGHYDAQVQDADLNLVAQHYLTSEGLRQAACTPFLCSTELLRLALEHHGVNTPLQSSKPASACALN